MKHNTAAGSNSTGTEHEHAVATNAIKNIICIRSITAADYEALKGLIKVESVPYQTHCQRLHAGRLLQSRVAHTAKQKTSV